MKIYPDIVCRYYVRVPISVRVSMRCLCVVNVQLSLDETYADVSPVRSDANMTSAFVYVIFRLYLCICTTDYY